MNPIIHTFKTPEDLADAFARQFWVSGAIGLAEQAILRRPLLEIIQQHRDFAQPLFKAAAQPALVIELLGKRPCEIVQSHGQGPKRAIQRIGHLPGPCRNAFKLAQALVDTRHARVQCSQGWTRRCHGIGNAALTKKSR